MTPDFEEWRATQPHGSEAWGCTVRCGQAIADAFTDQERRRVLGILHSLRAEMDGDKHEWHERTLQEAIAQVVGVERPKP